jgi:hypothetical protein
MKNNALRVHLLGLVVVSITFLATGIRNPLRADENKPIAFTTRITMANGTTRTAYLQGVGCSAAICSRVFIQGKVDNNSTATIRFDSISAIEEITENAAVFVMNDGTRRHVTFIPDFRVLYIANPNGGTEKLDLRTIKTLQVLRDAR